MKLQELLKVINDYLMLLLICGINFSCNTVQEKKDVEINVQTDSADSQMVDKLPSFEYLGIKREIHQNKVIKNGEIVYNRDSLLSIYLEDCIDRKNYYEGIFRYDIEMIINSKGVVNEVNIIGNCEESNIYNNSIVECLKKIRFTPAVLNGKNTSVKILVNVKIDLYSVKSQIREKLIESSAIRLILR